MRRMILVALAGVSLSGCTLFRPPAIVSVPPAACAKLIPETWKDGVEGYPLPKGDTTDDWRKAFVGQSGQLSKANGRTGDVITIVSRCEEMVNAARPR
jgi:hypothetical protein